MLEISTFSVHILDLKKMSNLNHSNTLTQKKSNLVWILSQLKTAEVAVTDQNRKQSLSKHI